MGKLAKKDWRQELYLDASGRFKNEVEESAKHFALAAEALKDVYRAFDGLEKGQDLGGFKSFDAWAHHADHEFKWNYRQLQYHRLIGVRLLGDCKLSVEQVASMGVEKAKVLAGYVRDVGHVAEPEVIEMAQDPGVTVSQLENKLRDKAYGGAPDHRGGATEVLQVFGPRESIIELRRLIGLGRRQIGNAASDAEVLCLMVGPTAAEIVEEEKQARSQIAGIPAEEVFIDLEGVKKEAPNGQSEEAGNGRQSESEGVQVREDGSLSWDDL